MIILVSMLFFSAVHLVLVSKTKMRRKTFFGRCLEKFYDFVKMLTVFKIVNEAYFNLSSLEGSTSFATKPRL